MMLRVESVAYSSLKMHVVCLVMVKRFLESEPCTASLMGHNMSREMWAALGFAKNDKPRNSDEHISLKAHLKEHIWTRF